MAKSSEQIQLALSKCKRNSCSKECPYHGEGACYVKMLLEAGILIRQLERERDAAVECLSGVCDYCKYRAEKWLPGCKMNDFCVECCTHDYCNWQWRGVQNDG